jgi:hypothetical protein
MAVGRRNAGRAAAVHARHRVNASLSIHVVSRRDEPCRAVVTVRRGVVLLGAALVAASCQPQTRRLLLLDETLTRGAALEATARPWLDAGYHVDYRRFYPHLTRQDLLDYRVVVILGGRRPHLASDALDIGDLAILTEWTLRGGVVVLGYPAAGEGALDRWLMNRWLAWSGAGIRIGDFLLQDSAPPGFPPRLKPILTAGLRGTGFDPFFAGVNDPLRLRDPAQAIARVGDGTVIQTPAGVRVDQSGAPVVAASRVARGLVIVLSRSALASLGRPDSLGPTSSRADGFAGTRAFLLALARWTRRPAEWVRIPPAGPRERLQFGGATLAISYRPPRAAAPPSVVAEPLGLRRSGTALRPASGVPAWIDRQGVRALEARFPSLAPPTTGSARLSALDTLSTLLDIGAFNVLLADAHVGPLADSSEIPVWQRDALRTAWDQVARHLQATSVRWIPLVRPAALVRPDSTPSASQTPECPLDTRLWGRLASGIRVLARLAATYPDLIPAVGLRLDEATRGWAGPMVCDAAWEVGLAALTRDSVLSPLHRAHLASVPLAARYDSLLDAGVLAPYDSGVADIVRRRAITLRNEVRRIHRRVLLAVVLDRSPGDWFTTSLVRGLSNDDAPVLVFSPDPLAREELAMGGPANVVHAIRLDPTVLASIPVDRLAAAVFHEQGGFWLGPAETTLAGPGDRLARQIRQLSQAR